MCVFVYDSHLLASPVVACYVCQFVMSHPICEQVHSSVQLALSQIYLKKLRRMLRKERGIDLYGKLHRDQEGALCSPYAEPPDL